jgi:radical SAM superfamily enzyme YgiQ (UPF0313 family)
MKTLLTFPKFNGRFHGFPLGIAYLSSYLQKQGINVSALDIDALTGIGLGEDQIKEQVKRISPHLVGVYMTSPNYRNALEFIKFLKQISNADIVVGGPHATFCHKIILSKHPEIQYAVRGEGEITLKELVEALDQNKDLRNIDGLSFKQNGKIKVNKPRKLVCDLDIFSRPERNSFYHLGDKTLDEKVKEFYNLPLFKGKKSTTVMTSRGCGKACSFCAANTLWGKIRYRSAGNVLDELEELYNQGFEAIFFEDDSFSLDKKRVKEICSGLKERGIQLEWGAGTRADAIDEELLRDMKNAGCDYLYFGVESGVQEVLDKAGKGINLKNVEKVIQLTKEYGIRTDVSMQFGLEGETMETINQTIGWLKKIKPDHTFFSITSLWPGAPLTKKYGLTAEHFEPDFDKTKISFPYIELSNSLNKKFTHFGGAYHPPLMGRKNIEKIYELLKKELGQTDFGDKLYI